MEESVLIKIRPATINLAFKLHCVQKAKEEGILNVMTMYGLTAKELYEWSEDIKEMKKRQQKNRKPAPTRNSQRDIAAKSSDQDRQAHKRQTRSLPNNRTDESTDVSAPSYPPTDLKEAKVSKPAKRRDSNKSTVLATNKIMELSKRYQIRRCVVQVSDVQKQMVFIEDTDSNATEPDIVEPSNDISGDTEPASSPLNTDEPLKDQLTTLCKETNDKVERDNTDLEDNTPRLNSPLSNVPTNLDTSEQTAVLIDVSLTETHSPNKQNDKPKTDSSVLNIPVEKSESVKTDEVLKPKATSRSNSASEKNPTGECANSGSHAIEKTESVKTDEALKPKATSRSSSASEKKHQNECVKGGSQERLVEVKVVCASSDNKEGSKEEISQAAPSSKFYNKRRNSDSSASSEGAKRRKLESHSTTQKTELRKSLSSEKSDAKKSLKTPQSSSSASQKPLKKLIKQRAESIDDPNLREKLHGVVVIEHEAPKIPEVFASLMRHHKPAISAAPKEKFITVETAEKPVKRPSDISAPTIRTNIAATNTPATTTKTNSPAIKKIASVAMTNENRGSTTLTTSTTVPPNQKSVSTPVAPKLKADEGFSFDKALEQADKATLALNKKKLKSLEKRKSNSEQLTTANSASNSPTAPVSKTSSSLQVIKKVSSASKPSKNISTKPVSLPKKTTTSNGTKAAPSSKDQLATPALTATITPTTPSTGNLAGSSQENTANSPFYNYSMNGRQNK